MLKDLEERYEHNLLKAKILNVACQLFDQQYSKQEGAMELEQIVNWLEGNDNAQLKSRLVIGRQEEDPIE